MIEGYSGATRLYPIIGDPIAQVKSPITMTAGLRARGVDAIIVPVHVTPADVDMVVAALARMKNVDGFIATVPHKFAAFRHCATATPRSGLLEAANMVRRNADGIWHGDMLDGLAFVDTARRIGVQFEGARALLVGAGGAGSAIGLALLEAGVVELAVHDARAERRDALLRKLEGQHRGR
jgi:shikimate dehydrogenase